MVAGSRTGSARGEAGAILPVRSMRALAGRLATAWERAGDWPVLTGLYLLAAAALLLPWPFGRHPDWAYNWEGYTAWRWQDHWAPPDGPARSILAVTDGLMTDSGQGPLVGLPLSLGIAIAGFSVEAMRLPVALVAALTVPVFWLLGRRVAGTGPASLAAFLLATSPAFLFYGRTATLVGVSLLPALLTALALARVLDPAAERHWRWSREGLLAASLLLGIFAYAPVRLLWPLAVGLLALAALFNRARRTVLIVAALLCALVVPAGVMLLERMTAAEPEPVTAIAAYFHARGEQLVAMGDDPAAARQYVRDLDAAGAAGWQAPLRLVRQNVRDLTWLLLDRDTLPVPTDYWNERGRFWPWFLLPFALVGGQVAVSNGARGGPGAALRLLPLALFLGLAMPLLLTSRVHVGRLVPALPFALLLAAAGVWICAGWIAWLARHAGAGEVVSTRLAAPVLVGMLLVPVILGTRAEMATPLSPTRESRTAALIAEWQSAARERGGAVLVEDPALGDEIERVHAATYRLDLDRHYRFVDLQEAGARDVADARPELFWHGALGALQAGTIDSPCDRLWFVAPEIADDFSAAWRAAGCAGAPDSVVLP